MLENKIVTLIIYFFIFCALFLVSSLKNKWRRMAFLMNILTSFSLSFYSLWGNPFEAMGVFSIQAQEAIILSVMGFLIIFSIIRRGAKDGADVRMGILYSFIFLVSHVLMGVNEWISVFICHKIIVLMVYPLLGDGKTLPTMGDFKSVFILHSIQSLIFVLAISFYFLGTNSFYFHEVSVINQDFFALSLALFILVLSVELGLFPFNAWLESVSANDNRGGDNVIIFVRKVAVSYFFITVIQNFMVYCDPILREVLLEIIKVYVIANFLLSGVFLLVQKNIIEIVSSLSVINMGAALLGIVFFQNEEIGGHLLFYLLFVSVSFLGVNLMIDAIYLRSKDGYSLQRLKHLFDNHGFDAIALTIFFLSLAGFPLTAGFSGKVLLYSDLFREGWGGMATVLIFSSLVSVQAIFKLFNLVFLAPGKAVTTIEVDRSHLFIRYVLAFAVIIGGVAPSLFLKAN